MRERFWILGIILVMLVTLSLGCPMLPVDGFSDPADPGSENYQGYPVIEDPDAIAPFVDDETILTEPRFVVSQVIGAEAYQLQVATDTAFASVIRDEDSFDGNVMNISGLAKSLDLRYWRSRVKVAGVWGAWSEGRSFYYGNKNTVYFDAQDGSEPLPKYKDVEVGRKYGVLPIVSNAGYVFDGWWTGRNGTDRKIISATLVETSEGHMLYAKWLSMHTVDFDSGGGSPVAPMTGVVHGTKITAPTNPTRIGYVFDGWYKDSKYLNGWDFGMDAVTADTTLYAKWLSMHTVDFDSGGGSPVAPMTGVVHGTTISVPTAPARSGYVFDGWYKESGYINGWNFGVDAVTADTMLYAKWIPLHDVTFNTNGGGSVAPMTGVVHGTTISVPTAPARSGYVFDGWYKESGYINGWNFGVDAVTADTMLYAKWREPTTKDIGPAGGYIFYDKGSYSDGWRYLEAAPAGNEFYNKVWGGYGTSVGGTGTAIGTGASNTEKIVEKFGNAEPYGGKTDYAAKLCVDLVVVNGEATYGDWFLPSKDELAQIYLNLYRNNLGGFSGASSWSSSEHNTYYAFFQYFDHRNQNDGSKSSVDRVRPVRAF